mmetsp:Transcript_14520/g.14131  ORF Transcript_14520/g.14131 Transcript_14520/m.14131 type:complete len:87 (+) Transcript_14520:884-1144(+)
MHTERRRVNTHRASQNYRFVQWYDMSPDASAIDYIKSYKLTRVCFLRQFDFAPVARQSYVCQEHTFKRQNIRDTHHDYSVQESIAG